MDFYRSYEGRKKALLEKLAPKSAGAISYERSMAKLMISQSDSLADLLTKLKATKEEVTQEGAKEVVSRLITKVESLMAREWPAEEDGMEKHDRFAREASDS